MSIQTLSADLASRIPEMRHDNAINNANVIQGLIAKEMVEHDSMLLLGWVEKYERIKEFLERVRKLPTGQNCPLDNHWLVAESMELLEVKK